MTSCGTARQQHPKSCPATPTHLWFEVGGHRVEPVQCRLSRIHAQDGVLHFSHDSERQTPPVSRKFKAKTVSFSSLMMVLTREEESLRPTQEQSSTTSGRIPKTSCRRERQRNTCHFSIHEARRSAAGSTRRCGQERHQRAAVRTASTTGSERSLSPLPRPAPDA